MMRHRNSTGGIRGAGRRFWQTIKDKSMSSLDMTDGKQDAVEESAADTVDTSDPAQQLEALAAERDQLAQEKADLQDRLLRRQAEFDNFRRRTERERLEFAEYASMEAVRALLPVLDDFDRALKSPAEGVNQEYVKGFELISQRLQDSLQKLGLEPINSVGEAFNPEVHQAVDKVVTDEVEDHTIMEEYQRGYNFKGRLLRPAMVKVAVRS
jgi:molecular chaperone GrpE